MTDKELRSKFEWIIRNEVYPNSEDMQDFVIRQNECLIELSGERITSIKKPEYFMPPDDCDLVSEVTYSGVEPEWMKEKAARGQERNGEDIQRIIDGYKYLLMKYKVGGKKK